MDLRTELRRDIADAFSPDPVLIRVRVRATADMLLALLTTAVAVGLVVGYQVLRRWGRLIAPDSD